MITTEIIKISIDYIIILIRGSLNILKDFMRWFLTLIQDENFI